MILDTSVIVAIALRESGWESLVESIAASDVIGIGAPTLVETTVVLSARLGSDARGPVARMLQELGIQVVPFTEDHYGVAMEAWLRFGKGRHPARLNFGDCLSYATARLAKQSLLFIGDDFTHTDIEPAS